jgi:hypothetical protein
VRAKEAELEAGRDEPLARLEEQGVRKDLPVRETAIFLSLVANGLALRRTVEDPMPELDTLVELVETGIAPKTNVSRRRGKRKTTVGAGRA